MSNLKAKFALWEQKAKKDTPKGPTMRPQSRVCLLFQPRWTPIFIEIYLLENLLENK